MGCFSSKMIMARSMSFQREDLKLRVSQRRSANGMPPLLEELLFASTASSSDHFLALVSAANKLQTRGDCNFKKGLVDVSNTNINANAETINAWELMAGLEVQVEAQKQPEELGPTRLLDVNNKANNRSKSCHWSSEDKILSALVSRSEYETNSLNKKGGMVRSRSFHTVEEYDAMVEKIWHSNSMSSHPKTMRLSGTEQLQHSNSLKESDYAMHSNDAADIKENAPIIENTEVFAKNGFLSTSGQNIKEEVVSDQDSKSIPCTVKGLKRKAIAKGLRGSLDIPPTTIEFPSMRSHLMRRCEVHVNEVPLAYSSGDYVTPKFGSYNSGLPNLAADSAGAGQACSNGEESILNPELVAAFEEFMQELENEEESAPKQIDQGSTVTPRENHRLEYYTTMTRIFSYTSWHAADIYVCVCGDIIASGGCNAEDEVAARTCESQSQGVKGACLSDHNCALVCKDEGFTGGQCTGARDRCFCTKIC
ncbi:hypothetical protein RJ639_000912 [Escallonia herrerae]|uniref:Knottins-like domain-containing protein n=1 Tax=Escallonia herrerae TaxID=1293975 RepID=A0AA89BHL7_9ASTE|nr:hypothetical protein RJ639_000912 [Escallonia herrerae]